MGQCTLIKETLLHHYINLNLGQHNIIINFVSFFMRVTIFMVGCHLARDWLVDVKPFMCSYRQQCLSVYLWVNCKILKFLHANLL